MEKFVSNIRVLYQKHVSSNVFLLSILNIFVKHCLKEILKQIKNDCRKVIGTSLIINLIITFQSCIAGDIYHLTIEVILFLIIIKGSVNIFKSVKFSC